MKFRTLFFFLALLCCLFPAMLQGADPAVDPAAMKTILGSDPVDWTFAGAAAALTPAGGLTATASLTADGKTPVKVPAEFTATFRLHPAAAGSSGFGITVGQADLPDKSKQAYTCSVSAAKAGENLCYSMSATPDTGKPITGNLYLRAVAARSLGWSEKIRKIVEAQMAAAPKIDELTCTLRLVLTKKSYRAWLNGRYIGELPVKADAVPAGAVRLSLNHNAELLSVSIKPYVAIDSRFEPIDLSDFLNAANVFSGQPVAKLPAFAEQQADLDGVAFRFPKSNNGNDHLDLGPSWTRFGAVAGYIDAQSGAFGGRWTAADRMDPSRFCMYVPYGQYKALHLIAAFDGDPDNVPIVTTQFYRPNAGHPMNFAGQAPAFTAKSGGAKAFPVTLANGRKGNLFHVVIPIDPSMMAWFSDLSRVGLELTKAVQPYRGYPDPLEYSWHGAGLRSGVHIYAATLEKAKVEVNPQPDAPAHVWTAPAQPSYTVALTNHTGQPATAKLSITTESYDGKDTTAQQQTVTVPAGGTVPVKVTLKPNRYGLQTVKVTCSAGGETTTQQRDFAYLHPETRERGGWERGKGAIFGAWNWGGGHDTPDFLTELEVMGQAGSETFCLTTFQNMKPEQLALARKYGFNSHAAFPSGVIYTNVGLDPKKYDVSKPEAMKEVIDIFAKLKIEPSEFNHPEYIPFFPEPGLGPITYGIWPTWYNAKDYQFTEKEEAYFQDRLSVFLTGAKAVRRQWPDVKILLPYGDPHYTALFLRNSEEARKYIDGTALDMPNFERLPEQQINQVVLNRLYPVLQDIKKYIEDPYLILVEGTCTSSADYDTTFEDQANVCTRNLLVLMGYGVSNLESGSNAPFDCANYWGENHYGGGYCTRRPLAMPKLAYVSYATLTRHVNRKNFVKYVPTGSSSVYCQQYKHYRTGDPTYVLWTIRGTRPVTVKVKPGQAVMVYDVNDNQIALTEKNGTVTFNIAQAPVYLEGMTGEAEITLGTPDHSDAAPAKTAKKLTNLSSGWEISTKRDTEYETTNVLQIERFTGNMTAAATTAPAAQGGKALAVRLGEQEIARDLMPYYTTIVPKAPITIPGKAFQLGLWVKAASDWGRVVYSLRDANGEKWISVGTKDDWNGDDMRCWSAFAFDGWRYLTFQLPSSAPYDSFRERGASWWGSYDGDGIVDLPLKLEKIIVERREKVIYGNELVPAKTDDVLLGDLYAEYADPADTTAEAVRQSKLRMPTPAGAPDIDNPIAGLAQTGSGAPTQVLKVTDPEHMYDGTRCHVHFTPVDGAKGYDVWVAPYQDGRGAIKLGGNVQPGALVQGLHPEIDFYVFVTYTDADGKVSRPSAPLKIRLKSRFVYK